MQSDESGDLITYYEQHSKSDLLIYFLICSGVNKWQNTAAIPVLITSWYVYIKNNWPQTGNETDVSC